MFTGLIEKQGCLASLDRIAGGYRLQVEHSPWDAPLASGDSVSVNGVCLTATTVLPGRFGADLLDETVSRTALPSVVGRTVNLERAMTAGSRLNGHFVTGHVDGVGTVAAVEARGRDHAITIRCKPELMAGMILKGSVACDGVSLTIVRIDTDSFDVHLIPQTWERTSLRLLADGDRVNLETDIIGKYVRRSLSSIESGGSVTIDKLREAGFDA